MKPKQRSFLDFVHDHRNAFIPDEFGFSYKVVLGPWSAGDVFIADGDGAFYGQAKNFADKGDVTDTFEFSKFFPFDNGEEPPYFRRRVRVDRAEAGMYFLYRKWCKKNGLKDEGFTPYPLPSKKQLVAIENDHWPFN